MPCLLLCADDNRVWKLLQSHRDISTGSVETAELALYSARDVQIYCTESLYFSLYLMSIFETNSNKHSYSVFKASLVTLCVPRRAHAHARSVTVARAAWRRYQGSDKRLLPD